MDTILHDFSTTKLSQAQDANKAAFWTLLLRHLPEAQLHTDTGMLWFETRIRHDVFNRVIQCNLAPDTCSATIESIVDYFRQNSLPFLWHRGPSSSPANLGSLLEASGMTHYETEPAMAVDLLKLNEDLQVASQLTIRRVKTSAMLEQWIRAWEVGSPEEVIRLWMALYTACLDQESPLCLYLGLLNGEPVATSAAFFGVGVASIESVGTLSHYRRQGIGAAMAFMALHEACRSNYRIGVLTASPMGSAIYRRIGFKEFATSNIYLWHPHQGHNP
ncbi:GNAT family N-acetyltransferase [Ktedonosporobacter rubrisoli]|uniref:GNAT family N-acetyltransferase n=1 Tax=Ktedonosporobacter rubrisoli TaxID=2509675 RepID=A0A4P6JX84_KTERU|nr:GNAT family N-acetyltransferase [Ktedonosporobacter rubrisoli]QBD80357.1 GNAT family N-acetyltransferase [Ktedonosporobacter rubrisoli]